MITAAGPKLVEYNCRFGDPECQLLMRCLRSDIIPSLWGAATSRLSGVGLDWQDLTGVLVTYASEGYPGGYEKGAVIHGIDQANAVDGALVFHAGTGSTDGELTAQGGRVLSVTALGTDREEARDRAYQATKAIDWPTGFYRNDIGEER